MVTKPERDETFRSALLTEALSLQTLAEADDRRGAWVERCGGTAEDAAWHRERATERRRRARELVRRYDAECRTTNR